MKRLMTTDDETSANLQTAHGPKTHLQLPLIAVGEQKGELLTVVIGNFS